MTSSSRESVASSRSESDRVESIRTSSVVRTSTMHIEIEFLKIEVEFDGKTNNTKNSYVQ